MTWDGRKESSQYLKRESKTYWNDSKGKFQPYRWNLNCQLHFRAPWTLRTQELDPSQSRDRCKSWGWLKTTCPSEHPGANVDLPNLAAKRIIPISTASSSPHSPGKPSQKNVINLTRATDWTKKSKLDTTNSSADHGTYNVYIPMTKLPPVVEVTIQYLEIPPEQVVYSSEIHCLYCVQTFKIWHAPNSVFWRRRDQTKPSQWHILTTTLEDNDPTAIDTRVEDCTESGNIRHYLIPLIAERQALQAWTRFGFAVNLAMDLWLVTKLVAWSLHHIFSAKVHFYEK